MIKKIRGFEVDVGRWAPNPQMRSFLSSLLLSPFIFLACIAVHADQILAPTTFAGLILQVSHCVPEPNSSRQSGKRIEYG